MNLKVLQNWEKKTSGPIFGQVIEKREAKKNNDNGDWNFHFILGMEGSLVQVWTFGIEKVVKEIENKIIEDEYFIFWGDYKIQDKYS